jgi:TatD DNase family protein
MLIDSHCHLDYPDFADELDAVVKRAEDSGVGLFLTISTSLASFEKVRAVAERYDNIFCTVGVHPHEAAGDGKDASAAKLVALSGHPKVVGIGETGLDYHYDNAPRDSQAAVFQIHIDAAKESGPHAERQCTRWPADGASPLLRLGAEPRRRGAGARLLHLLLRNRHLQKGR